MITSLRRRADAPQYQSYVNLQSRQLDFLPTTTFQVVPPNIHGDREFIVKVQLCLHGASYPSLVYDQQRSFRHELPSDTPGVYLLRQLIMSERPGLKGFFSARRQGENLRIFVDRMLLPEPW